jgi:hypothetical protein
MLLEVYGPKGEKSNNQSSPPGNKFFSGSWGGFLENIGIQQWKQRSTI